MQPPNTFEDWCKLKSEQSARFAFWKMILDYEMLLLASLHAIRTSDLETYIGVLKEWIPLFFALDKTKYAKWTSVHIHDLRVLKENHFEDYKKLSENFTIKKSKRPFSSIALDQAHEMNNQTVKGSLNIISLMDKPDTLLRWSLSAPSLQKSIDTFIENVSKSSAHAYNTHQDDSRAEIDTFHKDVSKMFDAFIDIGNPFEEGPLYDLETGVIAQPEVEADLQKIVHIGKEQYAQFVTNKLQSSVKDIDEPFTLNKLKLKSSKVPNKKKVTVGAKMKGLKANYGLFANMMFACQRRKGDLDDFFRHENQACPPSISENGLIRVSKSKAKLVPCLTKTSDCNVLNFRTAPFSSCVVVDGASVAQAVSPKGCMTYQDYAVNIFWSQILHVAQVHSATRIDVVFDRYLPQSIKSAARSTRGHSSARLVENEKSVPRNWNGFLHNSSNKQNLFKLLASMVPPSETEIIATRDLAIVTNVENTYENILHPCSHEEADTRMFLHIRHAASVGHKDITVRSSDTDVVVLAVSFFSSFNIQKLWVARSLKRKIEYLPIHEIHASLSPSCSKGLLYFHAFTGCDTVSAFNQIGKKSAWAVAAEFPEIWETFSVLSNFPSDVDGNMMDALEKYTVMLYNSSSTESHVNPARRRMVAQGKAIDRIPPSKAALYQHAKRAAYQAGHVWAACIFRIPEMVEPTDWGWKLVGNCLEPYWSELPEASKECRELIKCKCRKGCKSKCKCRCAALPCTELCLCSGRCSGPSYISEDIYQFEAPEEVVTVANHHHRLKTWRLT